MGSVRPPFGEMKTVTLTTPSSGTLTETTWGGDGFYITEFKFSNLPIVTPAGAAALAGGCLLGTLPAGNLVIKSAVMNGHLSESSGTTNAAITPDFGIGTVIGSGATAVLSGTATFENIMTGQTSAALNAATRTLASVNTILTRLAADAHTIYLNAAATWTGAGEVVIADGKVVIEWAFMD